jgi:signal transduction histidine kinase
MQQGAAWTLAVQAKRGSLDALVARSRTRNLALSLGVLGVLGAGLGLLLIASAREQRMARQQIEFVASVSHELRTPLAVIRSAAENLADGVVAGDSVRQYGALIGSEGRRLSAMVERVMDFAGLTAGTLIRARREVAVADVLAAAAAAIAGDARERGIDVELRCPADLPPIIGDSDALQSALQNALGNAVKYSHGGGRVEVDVTATATEIRIMVADRGIGIDPSDLPHVFEPFFRGRRAVDSQVRGSGVGLGVMSKIVEAHGGRAHIAQRSGGGTLLTIVLPVATGTREQA